jgi:three-Cys-motif partner protein
MAKYQLMKPHKPVRYDEVGEWSELKLEIVRKYAKAYSEILTKHRLHHAYIDGFAGAGQHISKRTKQMIPGSPLNALNVEPPFNSYYLIDLDASRVGELRELTADRKNVQVFGGDANSILLSQVFPNVRFEEYRRALCVLDPYGLHLNWTVIKAAADLSTIEVFLNFPVADMNRNVLWRSEGASEHNIQRMNAFWGDDSWRSAAYTSTPNLFGDLETEKQPNEVIADAFRERLRTVAGFKHVPEPAPMRNSVGAVVYCLFFAAHQPAADKIVTDILDGYRKRGLLRG